MHFATPPVSVQASFIQNLRICLFFFFAPGQKENNQNDDRNPYPSVVVAK
jgi:hypothetical protein